MHLLLFTEPQHQQNLHSAILYTMGNRAAKLSRSQGTTFLFCKVSRAASIFYTVAVRTRLCYLPLFSSMLFHFHYLKPAKKVGWRWMWWKKCENASSSSRDLFVQGPRRHFPFMCAAISSSSALLYSMWCYKLAPDTFKETPACCLGVM